MTRRRFPLSVYVPNLSTEDGRALGMELARLCDIEAKRNPSVRKRCKTCAFRPGNHLANGSSATLMTALKCVMERTVFQCHEIDRPCAGWRLLVSDINLPMPWDFVEGADKPGVAA